MHDEIDSLYPFIPPELAANNRPHPTFYRSNHIDKISSSVTVDLCNKQYLTFPKSLEDIIDPTKREKLGGGFINVRCECIFHRYLFTSFR